MPRHAKPPHPAGGYGSAGWRGRDRMGGIAMSSPWPMARGAGRGVEGAGHRARRRGRHYLAGLLGLGFVHRHCRATPGPPRRPSTARAGTRPNACRSLATWARPASPPWSILGKDLRRDRRRHAPGDGLRRDRGAGGNRNALSSIPKLPGQNSGLSGRSRLCRALARKCLLEGLLGGSCNPRRQRHHGASGSKA